MARIQSPSLRNSTRRRFLQETAAFAGVALTSPQLLAFPAQRDEQNELIARMTWLNPPASWNRDGEKITARSKAKTDFWRKTFYGYITDNGHFFSLPATGDFTFEARINGLYAALYDQAGLMVRLDAENWNEVRNGIFRRAAPRQRSFYA